MAQTNGLCVVLGNGPSLKGFDLTRLAGTASLGMNAAYRYWDEIGWYPDYYACLDDQMIVSHHKQIYRLWKERRIRKFFVHGTFFDHHPDCIRDPAFHSLDQVLPHWYRRRGQKQGWPDLTEHPAFKTQDTTKVTTGAFATRFCAWMGHSRLALMGIDLKYVEILPEAEATEGVGLVMKETPKENPNYFFAGYQQAGDKYNIPNPDVHGNELHIQSFRLVREDFRLNGQQTEVFNTNPASLLEDEKVFELAEIGSLLIPHKLAAVVVPATGFETGAVLENFRIWADPAHAPLLPGDGDNRCALVFMFNNEGCRPQEAEIRACFAETGMQRYFSHLAFEYLGLHGAADKYERDYSKKVGEEGYKSGPNNQFFLTMQRARGLGHAVFQMETDCVPLRAGWLSALRQDVEAAEPFWILGSRYHGTETLSPAFANHLNGNAVYAAGDPGFQGFLDTFWEPRTRRMVAGTDRRLAYDCILEKLFTEQGESDPEVAAVLRDHGSKFRESPAILNVSGKADLADLPADYRSRFLERFPGAFILHNRTAQQRTSAAIAAAAETVLPRLLVIDMTAMGTSSATGQIKSNLLRGWQPGRIMQVASPGADRFSLVRRSSDGTYAQLELPLQRIRAEIDAFAPEVILYRPLSNRPALHDFAMQEIAERNLPLVTWIMDDWPARLEAEEPERFAQMDADLRQLLARSALRLSICDAMSEAFEARYGVPFKAYANGIDPAAWQPRLHGGGGLLLRYAGGLAPDMNAEAVQRVARAVSELASEGADIRLEINTQPWWKKQSGHLFEGLDGVVLTAKTRSPQDYAAWVCEADALLIAYNFDEDSKRYVRYSMANKLPECLASGAALLVHGPREVATVAYAAGTGAAEMAEAPDEAQLKQALLRLMDPEHRRRLSAAGRRVAEERHSLTRLANSLAADVAGVCPLPPRPQAWAAAAADGDADVQVLEEAAGFAALVRAGGRGAAVYDSPEEVVAQALAAGADWQGWLALWMAEAQACLAAFRAAEGRVLLLPRRPWAAAQGEEPPGLQEILPGGRGSLAPLAAVPDPDPAFYAMAVLLLQSQPEAALRLEELQACSRFPDAAAAAPAVGPEAVAAAGQRLCRQRGELALQLTEGDLQRGLLEEQLKQLQAVTESYYRQLAARTAELEQARGELDHVYRSKSWRVTKPLREARRVLGTPDGRPGNG